MTKTSSVKMNGGLKAVKEKKVPKENLDKIREGINKFGNQTLLENQSPEMKIAAEKMARRLGKIDKFIEQLIREEGEDNISPVEVTEILMLKARHNAFVHTTETENSKILLWLIELILFNAEAIFAVTKAHLVAEKSEKVNGNNPKNAEIMQKHEKKSPKSKK